MRPTTHRLKRELRSLESLGDFVRRIRNEKGLSLIDVSKQSACFGLPISGAYINRIERNPKLRVSTDRLKALAHGLGIPVEELLAHAVSKMSRDEAGPLQMSGSRKMPQFAYCERVFLHPPTTGKNSYICAIAESSEGGANAAGDYVLIAPERICRRTYFSSKLSTIKLYMCRT